MATERLNLRNNNNNNKKIVSSEAIRGIKLKLCRNVHNISLYKNGVFIAVAYVLSFLWQLKFPLAYNGKSENWLLLLSHCRYFDKFYRNVSWVALYQTYCICPNFWNVLVTMATKMLNLRKKYSKTISEAIRGIKLKFCRNVDNIILYKNGDLLPLLKYFGSNLKFPQTYNKKNKNWI